LNIFKTNKIAHTHLKKLFQILGPYNWVIFRPHRYVYERWG